ncbi:MULTISPECIES: urease accessory protein UreD [unclassified Janthinobacterium]|uniref:urease accessory protein UreD n=1 Tax=unclassified Janthinobacterium TaxID=2610881 RepID=UPI0016160FBD|nr:MULTISPECIES: urease accessory protein UreD [unclassified Janthinobacterium]MBB5368794.1 urease accessory protein [Janthinobacterium sp. K2C7]MBB5381670.1 urease accessory protein [Janthinobacterium sp. K2Li3]MBB5387176.1 urease accessory protein [Janthinobacterium sp. K2E3]
MPDCSSPSFLTPPDSNAHSAHSAWQARLTLGFALQDGGVSRLVERRHSGPLRVQKALYPEGGAVCHAIIVHPPGGVVGGDQLAVQATVGEGAHAFLTSPGAAKWYRANGHVSGQHIVLRAGAGAAIEWMPQESIFFDQACVRLRHEVELAPDACYIGCDIICLGRSASGESFDSGSIAQHTQIRRGGKLLWWEQGLLAADGPLMASPLGMHGLRVCATLIAVGGPVAAGVIEALRAIAVPDGARLGVTQMKTLVAVRLLGTDSEAARCAMLAAWQLLRPAIMGRVAVVPRIWNT